MCSKWRDKRKHYEQLYFDDDEDDIFVAELSIYEPIRCYNMIWAYVWMWIHVEYTTLKLAYTEQ